MLFLNFMKISHKCSYQYQSGPEDENVLEWLPLFMEAKLGPLCHVIYEIKNNLKNNIYK